MPTRTRVIETSRRRGYQLWHGVVSDGLFKDSMSTCTDTILDGDCHPFTMERETLLGGEMTTKGASGGITPICINRVIDQMTRFGSAWQGVATGAPSNQIVAAEAANRTNPSRPIVDVPAQILELGDIALLLKRTIGDGLLKAAARNNLRYQFGIAPLVGDLMKLMDFNEHVERRVKVIQKLYGPMGYRRTIDFGTFSGSGMSGLIQVQSNPNTYSQAYFRSTSEKIRVHCRWRAMHSPDHLLSDEAIKSLARRAILGMDSPVSLGMLASFYEGMPWSWLIDWCSNVGDYLGAYRNIVPANLTTLVVMRDFKNHCELAPRSGNVSTGVTYKTNRGIYTKERKTRVPVVLSPTAHFPFLSGNQMGILASLYIARSR